MRRGSSRHPGTEYHPCGTTALGQVVDEQLKVLGVQSLRVVDASIVPSHVSGSIVALAYVIAEKAADVISNDQEGFYREKFLHRSIGLKAKAVQQNVFLF